MFAAPQVAAEVEDPEAMIVVRPAYRAWKAGPALRSRQGSALGCQGANVADGQVYRLYRSQGQNCTD